MENSPKDANVKEDAAVIISVSDEHKGVVDYISEYLTVPEDISEEEEFTEEWVQFMEDANEAAEKQQVETKLKQRQFEEQAQDNLRIILDVPGEIGKRLTYLLAKAKIEKASFARQVGVGRTTIHRYLTGETIPNRKKLLVIIEALSMTVGDFCFEPKSFEKWLAALKERKKTEHDIFALRDDWLAELSKNDFTYMHNNQVARLPHKYYVVLKAAVESSLRILDLLAHDKYEE